MSSTRCDKNASNDDHLDAQTREFVDALDHGPFAVDDITATAENAGALHVVEATLHNVGQRNALKQYAQRYEFRETQLAADRTDATDTAHVRFARRPDTSDETAQPDSGCRTSPTPILPDDWTHRRGNGEDVFEHAETDLTVTISKRYGQSGRYDDVTWSGMIRRGDGHGEPLTWGDVLSQGAIYAAAAKFAAGTPDGSYDPEEHLPDSIADRDRPRWPDVLGYDDADSTQRPWLADQTDGDA
ncbi:hypothetical protein [Halorussus halobius]|uniref:hypothetical protein n=1 Tax=Halorussus halobius TaxID=1710537 RepID=UPI00109315CC|nr:hypothetical protein [Halorussus halobius]